MKHEATRVRRPIGPHTDLIAETLQCSFTVITVQIIEPPRKRWQLRENAPKWRENAPKESRHMCCYAKKIASICATDPGENPLLVSITKSAVPGGRYSVRSTLAGRVGMESVPLVVVTILAVRAAAVTAHELAHYAAARLCGRAASVSLGFAGLGVSCTHVPGISTDGSRVQRLFVRHTGWLVSVALAAAATLYSARSAQIESWAEPITALVLWLVAVEAVTSDVLCWRGGDETFYCGNFGLLLLDQAGCGRIKELLSTMLRVTMMRGAQSAGLVRQCRGEGALAPAPQSRRVDPVRLARAGNVQEWEVGHVGRAQAGGQREAHRFVRPADAQISVRAQAEGGGSAGAVPGAHALRYVIDREF